MPKQHAQQQQPPQPKHKSVVLTPTASPSGKRVSITQKVVAPKVIIKKKAPVPSTTTRRRGVPTPITASDQKRFFKHSELKHLLHPSSQSAIAQAKAISGKGATPTMKKNALDKQTAFIHEDLYHALEKLGVEMELEDPQYIFYFYHSYVKPALEKEVDAVKTLKTGGAKPPHVGSYTPLNKHMQMDPDVVEIGDDVRSLKQLKFYKMLIYRVISSVNSALRTCGFKGKLYLRKKFYSNLQTYWEECVEPLVRQRKEAEDDYESERTAEERAYRDGEQVELRDDMMEEEEEEVVEVERGESAEEEGEESLEEEVAEAGEYAYGEMYSTQDQSST